jgi:hypothetical protein
VACIKVAEAELGHGQDAQWCSDVSADQNLEPGALRDHNLTAVLAYSGFVLCAIAYHKHDGIHQLAYLAQGAIGHANMLIQVADAQAPPPCILVINLGLLCAIIKIQFVWQVF